MDPAPVLSENAHAMLVRLAARLVPSSARRDAAYGAPFSRIVDEAVRDRPPALRRQLELFLGAIRWLPLLRHGRTFESLDAARQDALLAWLEDNPIELVRKGFWGLKALVFMGHYGQDPVARALGFPPGVERA